MQTLVIDTNGIVKKLEQRGFSRAQAEGITEALKELDVSSVAPEGLALRRADGGSGLGADLQLG